jgi:sigma-70-like protein
MLDYGPCVAPPTGFGFALSPAWGMGRMMDRIASLDTADSRRAELAALLGRISTGDQPALKAVYERTSAKLYGICLRLLGDEAEAQDVLQEVFVTVWRKAAQFDQSRASGMTWLGVLARNRSIDRLRARSNRAADRRPARRLARSLPRVRSARLKAGWCIRQRRLLVDSSKRTASRPRP